MQQEHYPESPVCTLKIYIEAAKRVTMLFFGKMKDDFSGIIANEMGRKFLDRLLHILNNLQEGDVHRR